MTGTRYPRQRVRLLFAVAMIATACGLVQVLGSPAGAAIQPGQLTTEPVLRSAAAGVTTLFGATPAETPGEVWGYGFRGLVRYSDAGGWEALPDPAGVDGLPLDRVEFLGGRTTAGGGVVVAAKVAEGAGAEPHEAVVLRDPGGTFHLAPPPVAEEPPALEEGEEAGEEGEGEETETGPRPISSIFGLQALVAASEEAGGATGAFAVPPKEGENPQNVVLHYDGHEWHQEEICLGTACTEPLAGFTVLAIEATGPGNAWILAEKGSAEDGLEVFTREEGKWRQQKLGPPGTLGGRFSERTPIFGTTVLARSKAQPLTVTPNGVWIDAQVKVGTESFDATVYLDRAEGDPHFGELTASWCDAGGNGAELCTRPLGSELPAGFGRSFAWPASETEPFGRRVITGVGQGAILSFAGETFTRTPLAGGEAGANYGAALDSPEEGWLGRAVGPLRITRQPASSALAPWPVPFRRPLTAIAPQPGKPAGGLESEALGVGDKGQVARYIPGQGWITEFLQNSAGLRVTPRLRAVAWPEPGFAYAVGDEGAMWTWRKSTGFWEPDPASPPNLIRGNFTSLAFDPAEPARGYAVGKQGLLLGYGRQWTQETLPVGIPAEANFTSVTFAGNEALATWRYPNENATSFIGGLIANNGSGWQIVSEPGATGAPVLVSGLADGGAALAFEDGTVTERSGAGAPWVEAPENVGGYPVALAAVREGPVVRAVVSISPTLGNESPGVFEDREQVLNGETGEGVPLLTEPYALPSRGYIERQTPTGWRDEQHESFPEPSGHEPTDLPREPDPVLALLVAPDGSGGWAVGGETGERVFIGKEQIQTASIMRYGASAAPPSNFRSAAIPPSTGTATFAFGGGAQCAGPCADQMGTGIGPEVWLPNAVARAATVPGVRDFIYTGPGVASVREEEAAPATRLGVTLSPAAFGREEFAYAERLGASAGSIGVFPTPTHTDLDRTGSLTTFASAFSGITAVPTAELSRGYYSFDTSGEGPPVRVIVLDYAERSLGASQDCWLAQQLEGAKLASEAAIVVGSRDLGGVAEGPPPLDAPETVAILLNGITPNLGASSCQVPNPGAASAYFFDFPEGNRTYRLASSGKSLPAFGSGTLGYVTVSGISDFTGASGFLLASVGPPNPVTDVAPVTARLIPNVGELAIEAVDGTLLRRSSTALFRGLARRPRGGGSCSGSSPQFLCQGLSPDPYAPIPTECRGTNCATGIFPEYRFSSSSPDVANFVAVDKGSANPRNVLLGTSGKPVADPTSGLLCAFNAGTTTVTLETGGFAYSTVVTVQPGSVQRPCGTVPLENQAAGGPELATPVLPPTETGQPGFESPPSTLPPPPAPAVTPTVNPPTPVPVTPHVVHVPPPPPISLPNFFTGTPTLAPIVPIVPPPPPPAVEPTPPSGTSPVTQPAFSPEPEEEEEAAFDLVHHAVAVRHGGRAAAANAAYPIGSASSGPGMWVIYALPSLVVIAALSSYGIAGRRRRRAPEPAFLQSRR
jgi:hypothetical protein